MKAYILEYITRDCNDKTYINEESARDQLHDLVGGSPIIFYVEARALEGILYLTKPKYIM